MRPTYSRDLIYILIHLPLGINLVPSSHATIFIILSPVGQIYSIPKPISLLAMGQSNVRAWPGGTGDHKIGANYAPCFEPQQLAAEQGYDQILWLFGNEQRIAEVGSSNVFVVLANEDGDGEFFTFVSDVSLTAVRCGCPDPSS